MAIWLEMCRCTRRRRRRCSLLPRGKSEAGFGIRVAARRRMCTLRIIQYNAVFFLQFLLSVSALVEAVILETACGCTLSMGVVVESTCYSARRLQGSQAKKSHSARQTHRGAGDQSKSEKPMSSSSSSSSCSSQSANNQYPAARIMQTHRHAVQAHASGMCIRLSSRLTIAAKGDAITLQIYDLVHKPCAPPPSPPPWQPRRRHHHRRHRHHRRRRQQPHRRRLSNKQGHHMRRLQLTPMCIS